MDGQTGLKVNHWAALATLALGLYLEAVEWIDLYPWTTSFKVTHGNNGERTLDVVVGFTLVAMVVALWRGGRFLTFVCTALLGVFVWLQVSSWWIPYFAGADPHWKKAYAKWYKDTVQVMPSSPDHLAPPAKVLVLQAILAIAIGLSLVATILPQHRNRQANSSPAD
jgi:hypothetical protein